MRVFKNKWFARFARREGIDDAELCAAIARARRGQIDADLGGGVIKQRIPRANEGRSGGFRSIVLFQAGRTSYFVYGFPKNAQANVRNDELRGFKELAAEMLRYDDATVTTAVNAGVLIEVRCNDADEEHGVS